jgi:hypothetical protein
MTACTIVTRSYLSYANVLAESYLRHHPRGRIYVLVLDGVPPGALTAPGVVPLEPEALGLPYFRELAFKYDPTELATALKPTLLAYLLERAPTVLYLDPDMLVLRPFDALHHVQRSADVVLTPHTLAPYPLDGLRPNEPGMLVTGVFNLGLISMRRSRDVPALLAWWESRLRDGAVIDLANGSFTDQKWADLVPSYAASTAILRDPAYNVAYWNLHERPLERRGSSYFVAGRPLVCFHFSGFDPRDPSTLSHRVSPGLARSAVRPNTPLADLLRDYAALHESHGWAQHSRDEYGFARLSNGDPIGTAMRRRYLGLEPAERARLGDPFRALDWARTEAAR